MSDFTSGFWEWYVGIITVASIAACAVLLKSMSTHRASGEADTTGHTWDEDLVEYNHPLPRWWVWLFWITIVFSIVYLLLYPGVIHGTLGWTEDRQYREEMQRAERQYAPVYAAFAGRSIVDLAKDPKAVALGRSLFATNCINCHGSDARGAPGFPISPTTTGSTAARPTTSSSPSPSAARA